MFSKEILQLLIQVVTSWQIIAVTVALIFYMNIVLIVARRSHYRPRMVQKKVKRKKAAPAESGPEEVVTSPDSDINDELGLEEG